MWFPYGVWLRLTGAIVVLALAAVACGGGAGPASDRSPAADRSPEGGPATLGGTDLSRHSVPLDAIHFDTFSGSSIPLSEITEEQLLALRDAIPPLDSPKYDDAPAGDYLLDSDLVVGYSAGDEHYAYPIKILNFHEIVNDELGGVPVLITYCPLCRSGIVFDRRLDGRVLTFGNTSALYETDLVMYDRETTSYWWQTAGEAIVGELTGSRLEALPSVTMTWADWKELHPDTRVLSVDTGFSRPYEQDPFAGYEDFVNAGQFPFPVSDAVRDDRLPLAEIVLGVEIDGRSRAYPLGLLGDAAVNDTLAGTAIVVFSRAAGPTGNAFLATVGDRTLTFSVDGERYVDRETGTRWTLAGEAIDGPLAGEQLRPVPTRSMFWFSYAAAFPDAEVYEVEESGSAAGRGSGGSGAGSPGRS